ncbi:SSI family serine proteinase inhibitor [Pseudokineococcus basanitobsidens]|uniref:SSI family serine proteinase inhibitor n=1 Tax=Pseudokineococcus basanitobsidens TaxID=1926649 RepID=A0ABU8RG05_9ACTN
MQPEHRSTARPGRRSRVAVLLPSLALVAVLGACGQEDDPGASPTTVGPTTGPTGPTEAPSPTAATQEPAQPTSTSTAGSVPADFSAELSVAYDDGTGTAQTYDLTCDGPQASGTAPDPAGACEALATAGEDALQPLPGDVRCTQVFGGSQTATVSGTVDGEPVSADLARADGCEIDRWDALVPLVPAADS